MSQNRWERSAAQWSETIGQCSHEPRQLAAAGRADLAFRVQKKFLPRYGFAATKDIMWIQTFSYYSAGPGHTSTI